MRPVTSQPFYHPARYLPQFHWELLACSARGHRLVGTDVRTITEDDRTVVREAEGVRWHRCLRCDCPSGGRRACRRGRRSSSPSAAGRCAI